MGIRSFPGPLIAVVAIILISAVSIPPDEAGAKAVGYVQVDETGFVLNGLPYYYTGSNTYYLMVYAAEMSLRWYVREVLSESSEMGLKVVRTWAFNDGEYQWNALQTSPRVYDDHVFRGLDYVIHVADSLGLRVILPLVNNWNDYGGMNQYVEWSPTASAHDDFYTDDSCRVWFKNHIKTMVDRFNCYNARSYRGDPAIFAWELANEPRCTSDPSGDKLQGWIEEMSSYIKSLDANHLVTIGVEGFYNESSPYWWLNGSQGCDFIRNHLTPTIDFCTAHSWPDNWGWNYSRSMDFFARQCDDAGTIIGKPIIIEEFGKKRDGGGGVSTRNTFFSGYYGILAGHGGDGSNFWILYHNGYPDYDGYGVYYPDDTSTIDIIQDEVERTGLATPTPVRNPEPQAKLLELFNYPNPFNPVTTLYYYISEENRVTIDIYDVTGRWIIRLIDEEKAEGYHDIEWSGVDSGGRILDSGVYLCRISTMRETQSRKIVLVR